jgi:hypothetical protein
VCLSFTRGVSCRRAPRQRDAVRSLCAGSLTVGEVGMRDEIFKSNPPNSRFRISPIRCTGHSACSSSAGSMVSSPILF